MDDQALEVLKAAKATEDVLAAKAQSLAAVRSEFERKQKEVHSSSITTSAWNASMQCSFLCVSGNCRV